MRFKYSAKTKDTFVNKKGEIDAPSQAQAIKILQDSGLIVYSLLPVTEDGGIFSFVKNFGGVTLTDRVRFTENLSNMLLAGLALNKSLEILSIQSNKPKVGMMIQTLLSEVESGSPLSKALEKYPEAFDESYISLIKAGEASGKLSDVTKRLAETLEKDREFKGKVTGALIYPVIVMFLMVGVFIVIMVFVIPQMDKIYKDFDADLPAGTQIMINISNFIVQKYWIMLLVLGGIIVGTKSYYSTLSGKLAFQKLFLKLPIFGKILSQSNIVQFARSLELLLSSGVPIVDGLKIVRTVVSNIHYKISVNSFIEDVKHGFPMSQAVAKDELFPAFVSQMLVVGEETGTVDKRLESVANYFEQEVDKIVKNLSTAIEPLVIVCLGGMVCILIVAVILPIFNLANIVK